MGFIYKTYSTVFSRKLFFPLHKRLYLFSLRGLGILNSENDHISGEKYLLKYLNKKNIKVIFDVGANVGQFANLILRTNPNATIYSFEPHPASFKKLSEIKHDNFNCFNIGLGEKTSTMTLYDYKDKEGSSHAALSKDVITNIHNSEAQAIEVEIKRLDDFCNENKIDEIDFLKIDVEGFELDVLKGASHFIKDKKIKYIQFEFNSNNLISRTRLKDFEDILEGYNFYRLMSDGMIPLKNENLLFKEIFAFQNIYAERT
jgi:FkbM family methyltransferase